MTATPAARPYAGGDDADKISAMLTACEALDKLGLGRSPDEMRAVFEDPAIDAERDTRLWVDEAGNVLAYVHVHIEGEVQVVATLRFRVHPSARTRGLDDAALAWTEARVRRVARKNHMPVRLQSFARADDRRRCVTLEWHGFQPDRYFHQLVCPLNIEFPEPKFPEGYTIRPASFETDGPVWVDMFNDTFIDHWGHHDLTLERYLHQRRNDPAYQARHDLIVQSPEGVMAGFCWSLVSPDEPGRTGHREALLHQIGTRRGYRQKGLGRATLYHALRLLKEDGLESVRLNVDAENPFGAWQLYQSAGFRMRFTQVTYAKVIAP